MRDKHVVFNNLGSVITLDWLKELFKELDGSKALGIDGISKEKYGENLEDNLKDLLQRIRRSTYRPKAARLVEILKGDGSTRPLAISCTEDKLVQIAVNKILSAKYEPRFMSCSFGFRPDKSCHDALRAHCNATYKTYDGAVVEIDLRKYFNSIPHDPLFNFLKKKINDGRFLWLLKILIQTRTCMINGEIIENKCGCPQGSIISPVLDKRLAKYGIEMHSEKSHLYLSGTKVAERMAKQGKRMPTYKFLGFTCYWAKAISKSFWRLKLKSRGDRKCDKLKGLRKYLRENLNTRDALGVLERVAMVVRGWVNYHRVSDNQRAIASFIEASKRMIYQWFNRRGSKRSIRWSKLILLLEKVKFPCKSDFKMIPMIPTLKTTNH